GIRSRRSAGRRAQGVSAARVRRRVHGRADRGDGHYQAQPLRSLRQQGGAVPQGARSLRAGQASLREIRAAGTDRQGGGREAAARRAGPADRRTRSARVPGRDQHGRSHDACGHDQGRSDRPPRLVGTGHGGTVRAG
ncbi:hypothetical protein OY671_010474, partial [Metschnikowia pulcherrima]